VDIVDLLLNFGADPNSIDSSHNSTLHLLALLQDKELDSVGQALRDAGRSLEHTSIEPMRTERRPLNFGSSQETRRDESELGI